MKITHCLASVALVFMLGACSGVQNQVTAVKGPVDYVNPYMGNISHLLVPTFPTIHLPNSMLRVYPERADYTTDQLNGLPLIVCILQFPVCRLLRSLMMQIVENTLLFLMQTHFHRCFQALTLDLYKDR